MKLLFNDRNYLIILFLVLPACASLPAISEDLVTESESYDESYFTLHHEKECDLESLIRANYPDYRIHRKSNTEFWFFAFKDVINTTRAGKFYLMEVFMIDYSDKNEMKCKVKYFSSLNKRPNRIQKTESTGSGLNNLIQIIKNCDYGE